MSVDGEELALVHLPRVAEALCSSLGGPCGRWPAGLRAWASSCAIMGFCSGYMAFARIEQMFHERPDAPVVYHAIAYETLLICSAVGLVATETTVILARATLPPSATISAPLGTPLSPGTAPGAASRPRLLQWLLESEVSPALETKVAQQLTISRFQVLFPLGLFVIMGKFISASMAKNAAADGEAAWRPANHPDVAVASLLALAMVPPVCVIGVGWLLFLRIPVLIVCDHIDRSTANIRKARQGSAERGINYDAIM